MNEKTEQMVREFAEKLGVTTDYVWEILMRQVKVSIIMESTLILWWVVSSAIIFRFVKSRVSRQPKSDDNPYGTPKWDHEIAILGVAFSAMYLIFAAVICAFSMSQLVVLVFNPEYWALKKIIP